MTECRLSCLQSLHPGGCVGVNFAAAALELHCCQTDKFYGMMRRINCFAISLERKREILHEILYLILLSVENK